MCLPHPTLRKWARAVGLLGIVWSALACQPGIGDSCTSALRCSTAGSRLCDQTQPGGYCTIEGCDVGTCPDEAVCVKFWPKVSREGDADRLGTNFCMLKCDERSDCRDGDGYDCLSERTFGAGDEAEVLGSHNQRFCAVRRKPVAVDVGAPDANVSESP